MPHLNVLIGAMSILLGAGIVIASARLARIVSECAKEQDSSRTRRLLAEVFAEHKAAFRLLVIFWRICGLLWIIGGVFMLIGDEDAVRFTSPENFQHKNPIAPSRSN